MGMMFFSHEELGKKDDDHKPAKPHARWSAATGTPKNRMLKRLAIAFALGVLVYLFINNLPTDVPVRDRRRPVYHPESDPSKPRAPGPMPKLSTGRKPPTPNLPPARPVQPDTAPLHAVYNGPIVFPELRSSLQAIYGTDGGSPVNKNVLYAAASLKSAALLLPMACQMAQELRNYVHFALVGGSDIDLQELRAVNGIDRSCQVIFHDARPDFAGNSATERLRQSIARALYHINVYMHPQAVIVDASDLEEDYFLVGIRKQAAASGISLIELPEQAHSKLAWVTKLDSSSLAAWDIITIDILINAQPAASGSLIHLLKSLSAADFSAGLVPHLTIELPHDVDHATTEFLKTFQWPPAHSSRPSYPRQLTLRHRIPQGRLTEEESSVRFIESFWPSSPKYSHVLVLSPQADVSSHFFHYLKYSALHYLYSKAAITQGWDSRLLSISLDLPSTHLDGSKPFRSPSGDGAAPLLWQAPNSNAALFTGQKWVELHALVSRMLEFQRTITRAPLPPFFADKLVSKRYPSWLEHALKLSRARGYWTLYPGEAAARGLVTVHSELYRAPEEYEGEAAREMPGSAELPASGRTLLESLPGDGGLLSFDEMPLLLWDGRATDLSNLDGAAAAYADEFRRAVGGCQALAPEDLVVKASMEDLFCVRDE
ncbi:hypothetical protein N658DRAFT_494095 [Parathielavia hyrcaniae]|uniref:Glycosyltransferase 2 n=1 Tax=Parathielavia hyrcaniae TaxID=113614 RepID=A0AAN6Q7F0_9PEZI|nr:hypothetical protein N658DRAFT_494095 [Parathielavia hyrcaniae]